MNKVYIGIDECIPGMKVADKIYNKYWVTVVNENSVLDDGLIDKLKQMGIEHVRVYDDYNEQSEKNNSGDFKKEYSQNVAIVKEVLHEISVGKNLDYGKVKQVSDTICDKKVENRNIIDNLNQIRDVDEYTYSHSVNVSLISMLIAKWLKFDDEKTSKIVQAGLLHDIGKSQIPEDILNKKGPLTEEEFAEIKRHPLYGYRIAADMGGIDKSVLLGILMHHEREDGTGYPLSAKGSQIHEFAKIIAVADIYDAMTSIRVYKEKQSPFEVFKLMEDQTFGVLDTKVVNAFLTNIAAYYIGETAQLSDGSVGEVVYINPRNISKPVIKVKDKFIDLLKEPHMKVVALI